MIDFKTIKTIHFIGIGGIGISAIARMMLEGRKEVSGSDHEEGSITKILRKKGAHISIGHNKNNIPTDVDMVIYTRAIDKDNPEIKKTQSMGVKLFSYPEFLGIISQNTFTIAVAGTHGKTTTTAMLEKILSQTGHSPTVIIGSLLKEKKTNFISGTSDIFVVEACEYKRSFLHLEPNILVITNIDNDHLDYYKDITDIQSAFNQLVQKIPSNGFVVCNTRSSSVVPALRNVRAHVVDYTDLGGKSFSLAVPGLYNIKNAQAALAVTCATSLDISKKDALLALKDFQGTWRRFEYKGKTKNGAIIYDDYAHHPTEIKAVLQAARELFSNKKIIVIFQPHLYSRTKLLLNEFAKSFKDADEVLVTPIYAAREKEIRGVNSDILVEKIKKHQANVQSLYTENDIIQYIKIHAQSRDVVFTMGAGDVYKIGESLVL